MSKPRCLCCRHWDRAYKNAKCDKCQNGDRWEAKPSCKSDDVKLMCETCTHATNTETIP